MQQTEANQSSHYRMHPISTRNVWTSLQYHSLHLAQQQTRLGNYHCTDPLNYISVLVTPPAIFGFVQSNTVAVAYSSFPCQCHRHATTKTIQTCF